ncbi:DUF397 domain-containing protein [Streptomyces sp. NPDC056178]|uniref:DUF397 domain-containing protein n=1 Tax=Streptomyces sp. NPDC056178 TaxID=3345735 RepID=UPI0035E02635
MCRVSELACRDPGCRTCPPHPFVRTHQGPRPGPELRHQGGGTRESSRNRGQGDDRVEAAVAEQAVHVRDSADVSRPAFAVGCGSRRRFAAYAAES